MKVKSMANNSKIEESFSPLKIFLKKIYSTIINHLSQFRDIHINKI